MKMNEVACLTYWWAEWGENTESSAPKFDSQFVWHLINEIDILRANVNIFGNILTLFFTFCPTNVILMTIFTK